MILIPLLLLGVPTEYYWREAEIKRDYDRIEYLGNGNQGERSAVLNIAGGCWAGKYVSPFQEQRFDPPEHLRKLDDFRNYFQERVFGNCRSLSSSKLDEADLNGVNLSGAPLSNTNLSGASLSNANLSGAYFGSTNLSGAFIGGTNLSNAYFNDANLSGASITVVDLSGADLEGANLSSTKLKGANLSGAKLGSANLQNVKFKCEAFRNQTGQQIHECPNLKDIKWNKETNWKGIQGWETVKNIPPALKQQLGLK